MSANTRGRFPTCIAHDVGLLIAPALGNKDGRVLWFGCCNSFLAGVAAVQEPIVCPRPLGFRYYTVCGNALCIVRKTPLLICFSISFFFFAVRNFSPLTRVWDTGKDEYWQIERIKFRATYTLNAMAH